MNSPTAPPESKPVASRTPFTLRVYQGLTSASVPVADLVLKSRLKRGKEHPTRWPERGGS